MFSFSDGHTDSGVGTDDNHSQRLQAGGEQNTLSQDFSSGTFIFSFLKGYTLCKRRPNVYPGADAWLHLVYPGAGGWLGSICPPFAQRVTGLFGLGKCIKNYL